MSKNRKKFALYCDEPSRTKQAFREECDINTIVQRAKKGMVITNLNTREKRYGDISQIPDYRTAIDTVMRANGLFMALPSKTRERFSNDPAKYLEFVQDPENTDECIRLGLMTKKEASPGAVSGSPGPASPPAKSTQKGPSSKKKEEDKKDE